MKEEKGNIWDYWIKGHYIVIPVNFFVKRNREAVMGRGLALEARNRFPRIPRRLGEAYLKDGMCVKVFHDNRLFMFPVKHNWWEDASVTLIEESCKQLKILVGYFPDMPFPVYVPRVGTGNGKLEWSIVKPILEKYLDDRFVICGLE